MAAAQLARDVELGHQLGEFGNVVVAFDHGRDRAEARDGGAVQIPHRLDNGMVVSIDEMTAEIAVTGQMELAHPRWRDRRQVGQWVETMIDAADVDIVDVEQDGAVGALRDFAQELPFAHLGCLIGQIARDILQQ